MRTCSDIPQVRFFEFWIDFTRLSDLTGFVRGCHYSLDGSAGLPDAQIKIKMKAVRKHADESSKLLLKPKWPDRREENATQE